jgi:exodeoxyribonuclease VII large subunit
MLRLVIQAIDATYTVGVMAHQLNIIRQTLEQEGIINRNRQRVLPVDFFSIAVISPEGAAGLGDFQAGAAPLQHYGICRFHYFTALFQGPNAKDTLLQAIESASAWPDIQALVIIRGGGAVADLHWLNELELARAVCLSPVPVMTGIGHQRDQTILDEVACRVADTPSKVIKLIADTIQQRAAQTQHDFNTIQVGMSRCLALAAGKVEGHLHMLRLATRAHLQQIEPRLEAARQTVNVASQHLLTVAELRLTTHQATVLREAQRAVTDTATTINRLWLTVGERATGRIEQAGDNAGRLLREILGQGPQRTLQRGFALVRDVNGQPVTSRAVAGQQARLSLEFHDGVIEVQRGGDDDQTMLHP